MNTFEYACALVADSIDIPIGKAALAVRALVDAKVISADDPADLVDERGYLT